LANDALCLPAQSIAIEVESTLEVVDSERDERDSRLHAFLLTCYKFLILQESLSRESVLLSAAAEPRRTRSALQAIVFANSKRIRPWQRRPAVSGCRLVQISAGPSATRRCFGSSTSRSPPERTR